MVIVIVGVIVIVVVLVPVPVIVIVIVISTHHSSNSKDLLRAGASVVRSRRLRRGSEGSPGLRGGSGFGGFWAQGGWGLVLRVEGLDLRIRGLVGF